MTAAPSIKHAKLYAIASCRLFHSHAQVASTTGLIELLSQSSKQPVKDNEDVGSD